MERRTLQYVVEATGGRLVAGVPGREVTRVCTDSRQVQAGDLFFALRGERFDGHAFVGAVMAAGAAGVVVDRAAAVPRAAGECGVVVVDDTRAALGRLAGRYRGEFGPVVVAVGGSNGKTTTKELVAAVLRRRRVTLASEGSFNNDIGVPLTLLGLGRGTEAAVLEVGTNHPGELAPLVRMIRPQFGILTSIGREHLEFFGDLDGVCAEEGWLAQLLPRDGRLFINGDSPGVERILRRSEASVTRVGLGNGNDWRARDLQMDAAGVSFWVDAPVPSFCGAYRVPLVGRHQVTNALLAVSLGACLGLDRAEIQAGLESCRPAKMRLELGESDGVRILNDAYNANADSVAAALETLRELPCAGRRIAVLGDMAELGRHAADAHAEVGRRAAELKVDQLFAVGRMAGVMGAAARAAGLMRVSEWGDVETAARALKQCVQRGDVVLIKASRASRLERIGEVLRGREGG